jgi:hypothetical protein
VANKDQAWRLLEELVGAFRDWRRKAPGRVVNWPPEVDRLWSGLLAKVEEANAAVNCHLEYASEKERVERTDEGRC